MKTDTVVIIIIIIVHYYKGRLYLQDLGAVHPVARALAHNLSWVYQVVQDSFVHLQSNQEALK